MNNVNRGFISVIVPNYNHARFLNQRLDSIFNQTYQNFEVIILDDCSADDSRDIIEQYKNNSKISNIVYNEQNSGSTFKQWKKGIELAKGEYIWIAESDDYANIIFLEKLIVAFEKYPNVGIVYSEFTKVDINGKTISKGTFKDEYYSSEFIISSSKSDIMDFFYGNKIVNASCVLFKKELIKKISDDYTKYKLCGDWHFWVELFKQVDVAYYQVPLTFWRQVPNSASRSNDNSKLQILHLEKLKIAILICNRFIISNKYKMNYVTEYIYMTILLKFGGIKLSFSINDIRLMHKSLLSVYPNFYIGLPIILLKVFKKILLRLRVFDFSPSSFKIVT